MAVPEANDFARPAQVLGALPPDDRGFLPDLEKFDAPEAPLLPAEAP